MQSGSRNRAPNSSTPTPHGTGVPRPTPLIAASASRARLFLTLDAPQTVEDHLPNLIQVGAWDNHDHTGDADLNVPLMTTNANVAIDTHRQTDAPETGAVMAGAGFTPAPPAATGSPPARSPSTRKWHRNKQEQRRPRPWRRPAPHPTHCQDHPRARASTDRPRAGPHRCPRIDRCPHIRSGHRLPRRHPGGQDHQDQRTARTIRPPAGSTPLCNHLPDPLP